MIAYIIVDYIESTLYFEAYYIEFIEFRHYKFSKRKVLHEFHLFSQ